MDVNQLASANELRSSAILDCVVDIPDIFEAVSIIVLVN